MKCSDIQGGIRRLAREALSVLPRNDPAYRMARFGLRQPIGYMRCAEFPAVLRLLRIEAGMRVLDVASPQWFCLFLARAHPDAEFTYANILESEIEPFKGIAQACSLRNLRYRKADVRKLPFDPRTFDRVVSVSAIEHVAPAVGGDDAALRECKRVMTTGAEIVLTLPYKDRGGIVYVDGPVFERHEQGQSFYAREYDEPTFAALMERTGLRPRGMLFIGERVGLLSPDYFEWGPGKGTRKAVWVRRVLAVLQRGWGGFDRLLAERYLRISECPEARLVNVAVSLASAAE